MKRFLKQHVTTIVVSAVVSMVMGGGSFAVAAAINATKLNGYKANQLIRLAESHTNENALVGSEGTVRTVTITAPKNGYLFMVASSDVYD